MLFWTATVSAYACFAHDQMLDRVIRGFSFSESSTPGQQRGSAVFGPVAERMSLPSFQQRWSWVEDRTLGGLQLPIRKWCCRGVFLPTTEWTIQPCAYILVKLEQLGCVCVFLKHAAGELILSCSILQLQEHFECYGASVQHWLPCRRV